jgi:hypothetical protein
MFRERPDWKRSDSVFQRQYREFWWLLSLY